MKKSRERYQRTREEVLKKARLYREQNKEEVLKKERLNREQNRELFRRHEKARHYKFRMERNQQRRDRYKAKITLRLLAAVSEL